MLFEEETTGKKIVPAEGSIDAKYVIVGEAPGATEERMGRPWVGQAGNLLMDLLNGVGIRRQHCYLTNVIKERPPKNDISKFIKLKASGKHEVTPEARAYIEHLREELSKTKANIIIAAGNVALWALTGLTNISKRRGSVYESTLLPGRKVIGIIHPSAALRQYMYTRYITFDLMKAIEEAETPEIRRKERSIKVFPSYDEAVSFLKRIAADDRPVAADIEVINGEVSHISLAPNSSEAMSICFVKEGRNVYTKEEENHLWLLIAGIMEDKRKMKIFQNGAFDAWFLFRKYGIVIEPILDTMIGSAIVTPDFPKGLDFLCSIYTDVPYYKDEGKQYMKLMGDEHEFAVYNAKDSVVLPEIMKKIEDMLIMQGNYDYFVEHCKLIQPLTYMQERGMLVDVEAMKAERESVDRRIDELKREFAELTGDADINMNSTEQLKAYFYIKLGIKPFTKAVRKGGGYDSVVTLDEKALKRIAIGSSTRKPRKEAIVLLEYRKLSKLRSTYLDLSLDADKRMRPSFNPVGTRYSRLSSSKNIFGTGANMQNQPHSTRRFFVADPGYLMFEMDLSQADWRVVAYLAQDYNMISALEEGRDIHRRTASLIFNKPEDQISDEDGSAPFGNGEHSERFFGKKANHALNYYMSANEFSLQLEIPLSEAKRIREAYLAGYPGIEGTFWESIRNKLAKDRTITNLFGRSYTFLDRWGPDLFKAAYAYIPQSTVADIVNRWGLLFVYYRQDLFKPVELLLQVHDSIVFQIPVSAGFSEIAKMLRLIKGSLEQELEYRGTRFRIPAEAKVGLNWGEMKKLKFDGTLEDQLEQFWRDNAKETNE